MRSKQPLVKPTRRPWRRHASTRAQQLVQLEDLFFDQQQILAAQGLTHLARLRHRGADLAHDDAGSDVGQDRRVPERGAGGERATQRRHHRIAGAGDVEDVAGLRRQVVLLAAGLDQHHPVPAQGDEHGAEREAAEQRARRRDLLARRHRRVHRPGKLAPVGRDQVGAAIPGVVVALGIDDDAGTAGPGKRR